MAEAMTGGFSGEVIEADFDNMPPELLPDIGELAISHATKLTHKVSAYMAGESQKKRPPGKIYFVAREFNAFGLPGGKSCPGSTDFCEERCYGINSEGRPATAARLQENFDILLSAEEAGGIDGIRKKIDPLIAAYRVHADKLDVSQRKRYIRWHWDGDFYSETYAQAFAGMVIDNPDLRFLVYTRSYGGEVDVLPYLYGIDNLSLFISVDQGNEDAAAEATAKYPGLRAAFFVDVHPEEADTMIAKVEKARGEARKVITCPENRVVIDEKTGEKRRELPLVSKKGGACTLCRYCIQGNPKFQDVIFLNSSKAQEALPLFDEMPVEIKTKRKKVEKPGPDFSNHITLFDIPK